MRDLPTTPIFTRTDLRALGWTDAAISRAVRSGRLVRVRQGVFAAQSSDLAILARTIAATRACTDSAISHRCGLLAHALPIVGRQPLRPELTVAPRRIGQLLDAHLFRATLPPEHLTVVNGTPVTTIPRTLVDVARHFPTSMAVAAIDKALHDELVSLDELGEICMTCWNWPGIRRAHRAIRLADGRAESPLESVSRLVLRWLKLPAPDLQPRILDEYGNLVGRLDFYWDEYGVFGEADGRSKYDGWDVFSDEKARQEQLEDLGLVGVRWGWRSVVREARFTQYRVERAFERGRLRDRSGFRRRWSVRPS